MKTWSKRKAVSFPIKESKSAAQNEKTLACTKHLLLAKFSKEKGVY